MPHVFTANGDGSYTSKDDIGETNPDADIGEAVGRYGEDNGTGIPPALQVYINVCGDN